MGRGSNGASTASVIDGAGSPADDDQKLVARIRRGDDRAFELLYERYHRRIHAYVLGMVKDHGRAEDVTQEVFLSALRRMRETEQPLAFKPWLYQIAKNSCIDAFRRSKRTEEVSYDADDALAPADHSKLVASGASPDAAVAAKLELDSLCGAFGGLSETHHEILVLRELEGLSYAEIGSRMGMSRPAVESTLFRARRRLTEEYDDIVSGARCQRIQGIILTAVETKLGTRDARRLARHLSHCQPCRREALVAGLDRELFARPTVRERLANKIAGILPFPIFARLRKSAEGAEGTAPPPSGRAAAFVQHMPMLSDHLHSGWGKAAAGAAVIVAGVGAGVGVKEATTTATPPPAAVQAATQRAASSTPKAEAPATGDEQSVLASENPSSAGADKRERTKGTSSREKATAKRGGVSGAAPKTTTAKTPAAGGAPTTPAARSDSGSTPPREESSQPAAAEKKQKRTPVKDAVQETTSGVGTTATNTTGAVEQTTSAATEAVNETTQAVTESVDTVAEGVTGGGPVAETVDQATDTVDDVVGGVGKTVDQTVGGVGDTVDGLAGGLQPRP